MFEKLKAGSLRSFRNGAYIGVEGARTRAFTNTGGWGPPGINVGSPRNRPRQNPRNRPRTRPFPPPNWGNHVPPRPWQPPLPKPPKFGGKGLPWQFLIGYGVDAAIDYWMDNMLPGDTIATDKWNMYGWTLVPTLCNPSLDPRRGVLSVNVVQCSPSALSAWTTQTGVLNCSLRNQYPALGNQWRVGPGYFTRNANGPKPLKLIGDIAVPGLPFDDPVTPPLDIVWPITKHPPGNDLPSVVGPRPPKKPPPDRPPPFVPPKRPPPGVPEVKIYGPGLPKGIGGLVNGSSEANDVGDCAFQGGGGPAYVAAQGPAARMGWVIANWANFTPEQVGKTINCILGALAEDAAIGWAARKRAQALQQAFNSGFSNFPGFDPGKIKIGLR